MLSRIAIVPVALALVGGCVHVDTIPDAKKKLPALRAQFERFADRSRPADAVGREEWETARRAYISELRSLQHDLDPGYEIEEAGYANPIR